MRRIYFPNVGKPSPNTLDTLSKGWDAISNVFGRLSQFCRNGTNAEEITSLQKQACNKLNDFYTQKQKRKKPGIEFSILNIQSL